MEEERRCNTLLLKALMLVSCVAMLVSALLLPLVNLKSYRWTMADLPHKISRLVNDNGIRVVAYVLLAAIVITPVVVTLYTGFKGGIPKAVSLLPLLFSLVLTVLLTLANKPSPGMGLWIYVAVAVVVAVLGFRK